MSSPSRPDASGAHPPGAEPVPDDTMAIIACGALSADILAVVERRGWAVDLYPLPPLLHNRPDLIAAEVDRLIETLAARYARIGVGYADCGTYSALDEVCARRGITRFPGNHCYDVYAGADAFEAMTTQEPGTYFLTDFLVVGFDRIVWRSLGLDRFPELLGDYFGTYRRVVWLAGRRTNDLERAAVRAAARLGLPLEIRDVGSSGLDEALHALREWPVVVGSEASDPTTTGHSADAAGAA